MIELEYTVAAAIGIGFVFEFHPEFDGLSGGREFIEIYRKYKRMWIRADKISVQNWLSDASEIITVAVSRTQAMNIKGAYDISEHWLPILAPEEEKLEQLKLF